MKSIQLKIWPEIENYCQALIPLQKIPEDKQNSINIDFSYAKSLNSSGLCILIIGLLKQIHTAPGRSWSIIEPVNSQITDGLKKLGLMEILDSYINVKTIFWSEAEKVDIMVPYSYLNSNLNKTISYPIYRLSYKDDRRGCIQAFKDWLFLILEPIFKTYHFPRSNFIAVLNELAKNGADHTVTDAFFGIDLMYLEGGSAVKLCFSFGDLGHGLNENVKLHLSNDDEYRNRSKHLSLSDAYHYALIPGKTTRPASKDNKGIGMSIVFDVARAINMELSVFDANSRAILTNAQDRTHAELRKVFYNTGADVGFYYYGEIISKVK